jgi:glyoxylase-like metal-dependent hydrolase (beta-lactamase superfamily II)
LNGNRWAPGLCALLAWACSHAQPPPPTSDEPRVARSYETVNVAPGIHAFIAPEPRVGLVSGNSVAVVGEDAVLVVDSGHFPSLTRRMIADIRRLTEKPIRFLVNTHWHPDHHSGNGVYRELVTGVTIVSTEYTRTQMEKQAGRFDNPESLIAASAVFRERLASGKKRDGTPLTVDDRRYAQDVLDAIDDAVTELRQVKAAPPDIGFEQRVAVDLGNRTVEVAFLGRGNTAGDAIVYVPDAKVLIWKASASASPGRTRSGSAPSRMRSRLLASPAPGARPRRARCATRIDALLGRASSLE